MGNPAGVPRDFEALEKRRFQAIQMLERGLRQAEIARQLRVVPQTVARWMHDYRTHGKSALQKAGRAGRKPRLSEKQRQQLEKLLVAGPERLGYETPLWTCPRVAHLIEQEFDVRYHEGHVWKILVGLGWSPLRSLRTPAQAMSGRVWVGWAGGRSDRRGEDENAMNSKSSIGKRTCGRS